MSLMRSMFRPEKAIKIQPVVAYRYNLMFSENTEGLKVKVFKKAGDWIMITDANQKKAMRNIATFLVEYIMNDKGFSRDEAVEFLLKTTVYEALMDEGTELYLESREAVLDILKEELAGNPYRLLEV